MNISLLLSMYPAAATQVILLPIAGVMSNHKGQHKKKWEHLLLACIFIQPAAMACYAVVRALSVITPFKYDQYVYCLDVRFGQPSFIVGQFMARHSWAYYAMSFVYDSFVISVIAIFATYLWKRPKGEASQVLLAYSINCALAVPLYLIFPVCGPNYAFRSFPFGAPSHLTPRMIAISAPPNGIPSVHMSTALLTLWFARHWRLGIIGGFIFAALTAMAAIGTGEHYLVDLIAAVPYAALVIAVVERFNHEASNRHPAEAPANRLTPEDLKIKMAASAEIPRLRIHHRPTSA